MNKCLLLIDSKAGNINMINVCALYHPCNVCVCVCVFVCEMLAPGQERVGGQPGILDTG